MSKDDKDNEDEDKPSSKKSFNANAKMLSYVSTITGGPLVALFAMMMYQQTDSKLWVALAIAGGISSAYGIYKAATFSSQEEPSLDDIELRDDDDWDDDDWGNGSSKGPDLKP